MKYCWQQKGLTADEKARLVVDEMTQDEKFAWLSGPMAIPMHNQPLPEGAIGSAAYYPGIPRLGIPLYNSLMPALASPRWATSGPETTPQRCLPACCSGQRLILLWLNAPVK
ncbi:hypothetical protein [Erwinia sp. E_sp_W01_1]|uniref:hypothetical protein n=1 Tax=unclassified Erwinia TaxID=2622719 RepID=UPI0030D1C51B